MANNLSNYGSKYRKTTTNGFDSFKNLNEEKWSYKNGSYTKDKYGNDSLEELGPLVLVKPFYFHAAFLGFENSGSAITADSVCNIWTLNRKCQVKAANIVLVEAPVFTKTKFKEMQSDGTFGPEKQVKIEYLYDD